MPGRVNLSVPPRLIESARAAQYANREVLDGRVLSEKIKARLKVRRAAVLRQQPITPDRAGGALDPAEADGWRIWRKRRAFGSFRKYTIEKSRAFFGGTASVNYPTDTVDTWTVYVEGDEIDGKQIYFQRIISFNGFNAPPFSFPVQGAERSRLYLSLFIDPETGDTADPNIVLVYSRTVTIDVQTGSGNVQYPWTKAAAVNHGYNFYQTQYDPLHAWPEVAGIGYLANFYSPPQPQIDVPIDPEYDLTRISLAPGYERTIFSELP